MASAWKVRIVTSVRDESFCWVEEWISGLLGNGTKVADLVVMRGLFDSFLTLGVHVPPVCIIFAPHAAKLASGRRMFYTNEFHADVMVGSCQVSGNKGSN
jgi:hypothetical protein